MTQVINILRKFEHPQVTAKGERRAVVRLKALQTLWFNTGTLCNITCTNCYIESSPKNDRLVYLTVRDVAQNLDDAEVCGERINLVGFTGGEPFMNPEIIGILEETLTRGFEALVLTNAMRPMMRHRNAICELQKTYGEKLRVRVSLDAPTREIHDQERGAGSFDKALEGLRFLKEAQVRIEIAGRNFVGITEDVARERYAALFKEQRLEIDASSATQLVVFPEMNGDANPPEITDACWGILKKSPGDVMCSSARMIVRRRGAATSSVVACSLLPLHALRTRRFVEGCREGRASQSPLLRNVLRTRGIVLWGLNNFAHVIHLSCVAGRDAE